MNPNCRFNVSNSNYKKVSEEVKNALGNAYSGKVFKTIADTFVNEGSNINLLTKEYVLEQWPQENAPQEKISRSSSEAIETSDGSESVAIVQYPGKWTRREAIKPENQDKLFVFTDNTDRSSGREPVNPNSKYAQKYGKKEDGSDKPLSYPKNKTSAVLRGLDNAMPISTQRWYHGEFKKEKGRWTNADIEEFKTVVHQEIDDIIEEWNTGNYTTIVLPQGGLLTESDITDLHGEDRSDILAALEKEVKRLYDTVGVPYSSNAASMEKTPEQQALDNKIAARSDARQKRLQAVKWDRYATDNQGFEVSRQGDNFARQFSPEAAVFSEGTKIEIRRGGKRKGKTYTFDIGGYSIEAAFQMIRGYDKNPKGSLIDKDGKLITKVNGKDGAVKSEALKVEMFRHNKAELESAQEFVYNTAYYPLYKLWASQNKKLVDELKRISKGKILTDKFAGSRISPARALAEVMYGTPKTHVSERSQSRYDIQRKNAIRATQAINRAVKNFKKMDGVKLLSRKDNSDKHIANLVNNLNDKGQLTQDNKLILSFTLSDAAMSPDIGMFINPFENEEDGQKAVNMFIQWIIPNDFNSLPDNLRVKRENRDRIRKYLAKGGYKKQTIITDGSPKNALYAKTLRYVIDNFEELRQRYNPENIQDFGLARHNVRVSSSSAMEIKDTTTMRFAPNETAPEGVNLDDSNSFKLEGIEGKNTFTLTFPFNFSTLTKTQNDRLFKTIAMAIPEGYSVILDDAIVSQEQLDFFNKMTAVGFTEVGDMAVTTDDGKTKTVGVFKRNGYQREQVIKEGSYNINNVFDNMQPNHAYIIGATSVDYRRNENTDVIVIPTAFDANKHETSYWKESDFDDFKKYVDKAIENAKKKIDAGYTIVLPKVNLGSGWMQRYTPTLFDYLNDQLEDLTDYGNREAKANQYFASSVATVDAVENPNSEGISLDPAALQSPRARLRQIFSDNEIQDFARYMARQFNWFLNSANNDLVTKTRNELAAETDADSIEKFQRKLDKLTSPRKGNLYTLNEVGIPEILEKVKNCMDLESQQDSMAKFRQKYSDAIQDDYFELIFQYAIPFIEDSSGIRINLTQMTATVEEDEANKNDRVEDTEGMNTPELIWQYQHRLVDPYKSLTKKIRNIISNIPMRDPNDMRKYQYDSIGQVKYWNAEYIYHSIMSKMAKITLGDIDNFMTIVPYDQLNDKQKRNYPLGKPVFPVLEGMKTQYPWANDLIKELTKSYNKNVASYNSLRDKTSEDIINSPMLVAEIGNAASQFYANFCQQFIPYCTMVDGIIYEENKPTGSASLRQTAVNNYQGNIRFKGIPMIYTSDGNVDKEGIEKTLDTANQFAKELSGKEFWNIIKSLKKEYEGESFIDMYEAAPKAVKDVLKMGVDVLKGCGMPISDYDLFLTALQPEKKYAGLNEIASELVNALEATRALPEGEHIFESSYTLGNTKGYMGKKYEMTSFYWNNFFRKFGDYVTEQEYESSFRIMGKSRFSYSYPSFMSTTMLNLTNPDVEVRRRYIEENFMPYDWFYDKEKGEFRNKMLEELYKGVNLNTEGTTNGLFGTGHDMVCKKDRGKEKEYQDWTPEDIYELMFKELAFPSNSESGNFFIPVISDSQIAKVIQSRKYSKEESLSVMSRVVKQELGRMNLVEKRNIVFRMQDLKGKIHEYRTAHPELSISDESSIDTDIQFYEEHKGKQSEIFTSDEKIYFDSNLPFYKQHKSQHPESLQEVENYDKNGSNFCFFPELNTFNVSIGRAQAEQDEFMQSIIRVLSKDMENPTKESIPFKRVVTALQNMSENTFTQKAEAVGLTERHFGRRPELGINTSEEYYTTMTKDEAIDRLISSVLESMMEGKVMYFFFARKPTKDREGRVNESLLQGILKNDSKLAEEYNKFPQKETENAPLTPSQIEARNEFYRKAYNKARDFYYSHTATMSQFIQLMVTDVAYYKDPTTFMGSVDFAKRWKEVYGAGMKLNTNSKFGKKFENNLILKDRVRRSSSYNVFEGALDKAVSEGRILDVEKDAILQKMKGIKGTDAQAFRSLTSWRDIMDMIGRNSEEVSSAIDNLRKGTWTMKDFYVVFNTLKPFSFGPEDQDSGIGDIRMRTMVQHKNSEAVLLAIYDTIIGSAKDDINYSPMLRGINRAMEEIDLVDENGNVMTYANGEHMKAIDIVQYHSAVKVGAHGIVDINYSRTKLKAAQERGGIKIGGKEVDITPADSYYDVEKKLGRMLDNKEISFEDYERAMDWFEPDEDEVFEIIRSSIYKNGDESLGYDRQVLHRLPYENYCIQQPTDDHYTDNDAGTFGSQPRHIIMADLPDDFEITINGKKYNRDQIRERYNSLLVANLLDCFENDIEPLFKGKGTKSALERLRDRLLPIVETNPKYAKLKDALQIVTGPDGKPTFALPLNNPTVTAQLEEVITSMFKNSIHRQTIAGGNVILAADVGYSKKLKVRGKRDENGKLTQIEGIECLLPAHSKAMFEPYLEKRTTKNGETYFVLDPQKLKDAGLDKLIGYRIPTEGLYSIMPLIVKGFLPQQSGSSIVVAQEIVELSGSDNDVDKLYLMMKVADKSGAAAKAPSKKHVLEMSKVQRDNELVDIFYGITTHPQMTHLWAHPGNFDTLTTEAKSLQILKDNRLRKMFVERAGIQPTVDGRSVEELTAIMFTEELSQKQLNNLYRKVMQVPESEQVKDKTMLDIVEDFTDKYASPLSPVYPDTFVAMHQSYMAGVAEKGIFANNTLDHAKLQWADVKVLPTHTFTFNGNKIEKVDERYFKKAKNGKNYLHYISSDCAECSAAAVDNGKKPVLDKLNCTKQTATFYGFLLRLGLGIKGASYLLAQPAVNWSIKSSGAINPHTIESELKKIAKWLKDYNFDLQDERFSWRAHNFTNRELCMNVYSNLNDLLNKGRDPETVERMASLYRTYGLILNLRSINKAMSEPRNVLHYDSPTHAADSSIGGVIEQVKAVEELNDRENQPEFDRRLSGEDQLLVHNIDKKVQSKQWKGKSFKLSDYSPEERRKHTFKYQMFESLMSAELPVTQAFYTLGIEKIREELAPHFAFGRPEMQSLTDRLWKYMQTPEIDIYRSEDRRKIITQMYRDWVVYKLSKTSLFGDDADMTFDQKRQYYLYDFPKNFLKIKGEVTEANMIDAIRRMSVRKGQIIMDRGGKTTITLRDFISDSFDTLIQSKNPELVNLAKKLFMYTYYLNGFEFSYMSFGNMLSTEFQRAFPEYIQALADMNTEVIDESDLDNFFQQFIVKRNNMGLVPATTFRTEAIKQESLQRVIYNTEKTVEEYGSWAEVPEFTVYSSVKGNEAYSTLLQLNKELSDLYKTVVYLPIKTNTSLHFNANQTLDEMLDVVYDQEKIVANSNIGVQKRNRNSVGYDTYQSTQSQKEVSTEKDANVQEPSEDISKSVSAAANTEEGEMSDSSMDKAVGATSSEEAEIPLIDYDKAMRNTKNAGATQKEDPDIEEAQRKLEQDNNGRGLCVTPE